MIECGSCAFIVSFRAVGDAVAGDYLTSNKPEVEEDEEEGVIRKHGGPHTAALAAS